MFSRSWQGGRLQSCAARGRRLGELDAAPGFHHAAPKTRAAISSRSNMRVVYRGRGGGVADAGFACDGHAGELQVLYIA